MADLKKRVGMLEKSKKPEAVPEKSKENLRPREKGSKNKVQLVGNSRNVITVNVGDYDDYLNRMSKDTGTEKTKYLQKLIIADYEAHREEYEKLKDLPLFDHVKKPCHTKKNTSN